jgi:serine/threonine-protein kinase
MARTYPSLPDSIGRYEVVERLGQGAMGRVFLARDPVLERNVALKMLRDDLGLTKEHQKQLFERMRQEARASARISHPNIVALFDMGEDPVYGLYLVFEYVKGATLKEYVGNHALDPNTLGRLAQELGSALTTAHEAGVFHRDIKPENVIMSVTGSKIADFGIARLPESTLTRDGRLLGTPAYSSPESISYGTFSPASDQFSLAATLYEAISGKRAFPGDEAVAVATLITTSSPSAFAESLGLDRAVDEVLLRGMSKDPKSRYSSCEQFGNALADALLANGKPLVRSNHLPHLRSVSMREREIGGKPLRVVAGAATVGALVMALVLHATRRCEGPQVAPSVNAPPSITPLISPSILQRTLPKSERHHTSPRASNAKAPVGPNVILTSPQEPAKPPTR